MITLDKQLAEFDSKVDIAYERCLQMMVEDREAIITLARHRLIASYTRFRDTGWHRAKDALARDCAEELADALVYKVMAEYGGHE